MNLQDHLLLRAFHKYGNHHKKTQSLLNLSTKYIKSRLNVLLKKESVLKDLVLVRRLHSLPAQYNTVGTSVGMCGEGVVDRIEHLCGSINDKCISKYNNNNTININNNNNNSLNTNSLQLTHSTLNNIKSRKQLRSSFLRKEIHSTVVLVKKGRKGINDILNGMPRPVNK